MGFVSAALGLLLGDRRRAVLLAVLLLGRGVRRADDGHVDAGGEDGQDRRDDELDEEEPARGGSPARRIVVTRRPCSRARFESFQLFVAPTEAARARIALTP